MILPALRCGKGGANTLWALLTFEKYKTTNFDVYEIRSYSRNIFQWNKNDIKA